MPPKSEESGIIQSIKLSKDFETDQNENVEQNIPRDPKQTIKSNDANNEFNVKSGMANYKCKVFYLLLRLLRIWIILVFGKERSWRQEWNNLHRRSADLL